MKKFTFTCFIFCVLFTIGSCTRDQIETPNDELITQGDVISQIQVHESTTLLSDIFIGMGVSKITVTNGGNTISYMAISEKISFLNGEPFILSDYEIILENNYITLKNNPDVKITLIEEQPYINSPEFNGFLYETDEEISLETIVLILYLNELTLDDSKKDEFFGEDNINKGCSFWDTYYVYSTGVSESVAEDRLDSEISSYGMKGCTVIGEADTSCLYGSHFCISSQAFCCE